MIKQLANTGVVLHVHFKVLSNENGLLRLLMTMPEQSSLRVEKVLPRGVIYIGTP